MSNQDSNELHWSLAVLRRWWWLILGGTGMAALVAFILLSSLPPTYEATTTLLIQPAQNAGLSEYNALIAGERLAYTYSEMLKSRPVLEKVIAQAGLQENPDELADKIAVEPLNGTQLIRFTVTGPTPQEATLLANEIAEAFTAYIALLQTEQYTTDLQSQQLQMDSLTQTIESGYTNIQNLSAQKSNVEAELLWQENLLANDRNNYMNLQNDIQSMQLKVDQIKDSVKIVEPAHLSGSPFLRTATVTLLVDPSPVPGGSSYSALTYNEMLTGPSVLAAAIAKLGLDITPETLADQVRANPVSNTQLISLAVTDADGARALTIADTVASVFVTQMQQVLAGPYSGRLDNMQTQIDALSTQMENTQARINELTAAKIQAEAKISLQESLIPNYRDDLRALQQDYEQLRLTSQKAADTVMITEPATLPDTPVQHLALYVALAALIGAIASLGLALFLQYMDDTIKSTDDIQALDLGELGMIGRLGEDENELIVVDQPRSPIAEAFRVLVANLRLSSPDHQLRTLLVTSPDSNEGKSMVAANLAVSMARAGVSVILVDADLRIPRLQQIFNLKQAGGLTEVLLNDEADFNLQDTTTSGLRVLTSGVEIPNPAELIGSPRLAKVLDALSEQADLVLIDCSPVLPVADTSHVAALADGVLLVLRANQTRQRTAQNAVRGLRQIGAHLIGIVLNGLPAQNRGYYSYYQAEEEKISQPRRIWNKSLATAQQLFKKQG